MHPMHNTAAEQKAIKAFQRYQIARARVASRAAALALTVSKEKDMARRENKR